jgi:hypothetical protein
VAHYYITKDASTDGMPDGAEKYASLPDYRDSKYFWLVPPIAMINAKWCWSHGVQATGKFFLWGIWFPKKPHYPRDGRYPGEVMKILLTEKLDLSGVSSQVLCTAPRFLDTEIARLVQRQVF